MDIHLISDFFLHIDKYLEIIFQNLGFWTYLFLFLILFAETGLVILPFLPGDSLLFSIGAFAALGFVDIKLILITLSLGAIIGDSLNYYIGKNFGQKLVDNPKIPINQNHVTQTQEYYSKNGGKTIILARFIPIIRTFAPFVAGFSKMKYKDFMIFNIVGGFTWVFGITLVGYFFGNLPGVKENLEYAIFIIIGVSLLPVLFEFINIKFKHKK